METTFAEWLKNELNIRNLKETDFARKIDTTRQVINRYTLDQRIPDDEMLNRIAVGLHLPADEVFRAAGKLPPTIQNQPINDRLLYKFNLLTPEEQAEALEYIEFKILRRDQSISAPNLSPKLQPK